MILPIKTPDDDDVDDDDHHHYDYKRENINQIIICIKNKKSGKCN